MKKQSTITVSVTVQAPVNKVWDYWNQPDHIMQWNNASNDWHTPRAENNLRINGTFNYRMEARDGSVGFDFRGVYDEIQPRQHIRYTIDDGRKVQVTFSGDDTTTDVTETFDAESTNSVDMQQAGWQAILDNFKKYTETH